MIRDFFFFSFLPTNSSDWFCNISMSVSILNRSTFCNLFRKDLLFHLIFKGKNSTKYSCFLLEQKGLIFKQEKIKGKQPWMNATKFLQTTIFHISFCSSSFLVWFIKNYFTWMNSSKIEALSTFNNTFSLLFRNVDAFNNTQLRFWIELFFDLIFLFFFLLDLISRFIYQKAFLTSKTISGLDNYKRFHELIHHFYQIQQVKCHVPSKKNIRIKDLSIIIFIQFGREIQYIFKL